MTRKKIIVFTAVTLFFFLIAGEIALRMLGFRPVETCYTNAPGIHHIHKPHWQGMHVGKPLWTNQWGLRDEDFPKKKPAGEFRILCLGDSVTFGYGVSTGEDYPAQLEEMLNKRSAGKPKYQVINSGVDAYTPHEEVEYYLRYGVDFDPDKVIIGICLNDVTETNVPMYVPGKELLKKSAYYWLLKEIRHRLVTADIKDKQKQIYGLRDDVTQEKVSPETERSWETVFVQVRRLKEAMGDRAASDLLVILFPVESQTKGGPTGAQERVAEFCKTEGLQYFNPLSILKSDTSERLFGDELHLSPAGCRLVAQYLADYYLPPEGGEGQ